MGLPSRLFVLLLVGNQWVNARSFQRPVFTKWLFVAQERPAAAPKRHSEPPCRPEESIKTSGNLSPGLEIDYGALQYAGTICVLVREPTSTYRCVVTAHATKNRAAVDTERVGDVRASDFTGGHSEQKRKGILATDYAGQAIAKGR